MHLYDFILLSKVHNLSYSEMRCNNCTVGFLNYLESKEYNINQRSDSHVRKNITFSRGRSDNNRIDS